MLTMGTGEASGTFGGYGFFRPKRRIGNKHLHRGLTIMIRFVPEMCFRLLFLVGIFCLFCGVVTHPALRSTARVDVVLSDEEVKDPKLVEATRIVLERGVPNAERIIWITWLIVGGANLSLSIFGLYTYLPAQAATVLAWTKGPENRT